MKGRLIIISAPSGAGKTTIVKNLLSAIPDLEFSISACSRSKRPGETHGKDYYYLTIDEFREKISNNEFLEWEEVYKDHYYGTLRSEVERIRNSGKHAVVDVDIAGGLNIKREFGEEALSVFIQPPSSEVLEQRLRNRGTETPDNLETRIRKAEYELGFADQFDTIIINKDLHTAIEDARTAVKNFIKQ